MAWRNASSSFSFSRAFSSAARSSPLRSPPPLPRIRPTLPSRRPSSLRNLGAIGCVQSVLPLRSVPSPCLTSYLTVSTRACCDLSHGSFTRSCQDR